MRKIAFFVGSDILAHLILNRVVNTLMIGKEEFQIEPVLYFPEHPVSKKAMLPELQEGAFFERTLLQHAYDYFDEHPTSQTKNLSPKQLAQKYGLQIESVPDVNDPAFIQTLADDKDLFAAISIRCFQIFGPEIVDVIRAKDPRDLFLNLHPGMLPEYRGVMSTAWRMKDIQEKNDSERLYGCTLHKVEPGKQGKYVGIDTGRIVGERSERLPERATVYGANIAMASPGTKVIMDAITKIIENDGLRGYPQTEGTYRTYPTADELKTTWKSAGITIGNEQEAIHSIAHHFSRAGTPHAEDTIEYLEGKVRTWRNKDKTEGNGNTQPVTPDQKFSAIGFIRNGDNARHKPTGPDSAVA